MTKIELIERLNTIATAIATAPGYHYEVKVRDWENYGKSRTYFSIAETIDNSKHYVVRDYGYYDNKADKYVAGKNNLEGTLYNFSGARL